jgi:hypothetical protein
LHFSPPCNRRAGILKWRNYVQPEKETKLKSRVFRCLIPAISLALLLSLVLTSIASAFVVIPLYPPGPPYSRIGNGGTSPNTWSESGQGNPQFGRSGSIFWWQCPPLPVVVFT